MILDNPNAADLYTLQLKHGDVIIIYVSILDFWPNLDSQVYLTDRWRQRQRVARRTSDYCQGVFTPRSFGATASPDHGRYSC